VALRATRILKGGTALNLFFLDVPRLSVDIDVDYVGQGDLEAMQAARPAFEVALVACSEREDGVVRRAPTEHAGGKFRLRYTAAARWDWDARGRREFPPAPAAPPNRTQDAAVSV
jgi:hypothetical protein